MNSSARTELLDRLAGLGILDEPRCEAIRGRVPPPWWLAVLQGIAAWIASLFIISSFSAPLILLVFGEGPIGRGICGVILLAAAIWLFARARMFTDQMGLAFSLAGQALVVSAFAGDFDMVEQGFRTLATISALVAAGMLVPRSTPLHRVACALLICSSLAVLVGSGDWLLAYFLLVATLAVAGWLTRSQWAAHPWAPRLAAGLHAATFFTLVSAWGAASELGRAALSILAPWIYQGGIAVLLIGAAAWLTRDTPLRLRGLALGGALLLVVAAWKAPGLIASATILVVVFHACHRPWILLALLAATFYLGEYYYSLETTLLVKSAALAATGLVLLGLRLALRRIEEVPA